LEKVFVVERCRHVRCPAVSIRCPGWDAWFRAVLYF
jgi:hypothetical protein